MSSLATPRRLIAGLFVLSLGVLGAALAFEYLVGLVPCELCLLERKPWYATLVATGLLLILRRPALARPASALFLLLFLASAGLSLYHVGVEQHLIDGPTACTAPATGAKSIEDLTAQLLATPPVRCDEVQWSLLGISLAGWNALASLGVVAAAFAALRRRTDP